LEIKSFVDEWIGLLDAMGPVDNGKTNTGPMMVDWAGEWDNIFRWDSSV
jgi:hypothetical protein